MNIKLFGYSISLNVIILIGILYLIMVVNALSGSCNREGMIGNDSYIADLVKSIEFAMYKAKRNEQPLTTQQINNFRAELDGLTPQDPDLLGQITKLKAEIDRIEQSQVMPQAPPITSRPQIAPTAQLEPEPIMPQAPPITSRPQIAPTALLEPEPMMPQAPMITSRPQIAPTAPVEPEPLMREVPPMLKGPAPKLGSIMNKFKKRF